MNNPLLALGKALTDKAPKTAPGAKPAESGAPTASSFKKDELKAPAKPSADSVRKDAAPLIAAHIGGKSDGDKAGGSPTSPAQPDAETHRKTAELHYAEGRRLWLQRNSAQAPTPEHYQAGLGLLVASLLAAALDPTHQAGSIALQTGNQIGQQQVDFRNKLALDRFNRNQAGLGDQANLEMQQGQREDALAQQAQDEANYLAEQSRLGVNQEQAQKNWTEEQALRVQAEKDRQQADSDRQTAADFEGALKAAGSTDPTLRRFGFAVLAGHLSHNADALRRLGYDPDEYQKALINAAGNKTPQQLLQEAMTAEHTATAEQKQKLTPEMVNKTKAEVAKIRADSGLDEAKARELNDKLGWMPLEERAKVAKLGADMSLAYQRIKHLKHVDANDKGLQKIMKASDDQIAGYERMINSLLRERAASDKLAKRGDKNSIAAIKDIDSKLTNYRHLRNLIQQQASRMMEEIAARQGASAPQTDVEDDFGY